MEPRQRPSEKRTRAAATLGRPLIRFPRQRSTPWMRPTSTGSAHLRRTPTSCGALAGPVGSEKPEEASIPTPGSARAHPRAAAAHRAHRRATAARSMPWLPGQQRTAEHEQRSGLKRCGVRRRVPCPAGRAPPRGRASPVRSTPSLRSYAVITALEPLDMDDWFTMGFEGRRSRQARRLPHQRKVIRAVGTGESAAEKGPQPPERRLQQPAT